jgi:hypothetical protein
MIDCLQLVASLFIPALFIMCCGFPGCFPSVLVAQGFYPLLTDISVNQAGILSSFVLIHVVSG